MARVLIEGFEGGGTPYGWSLKKVSIENNAGCDGNYCARFTDGFGHLIYPLRGGPYSEIYVYFKWKITTGTAYNWDCIGFFKYTDPWDASGWLADMRLTASTYLFEAWNGRLVNYLATGTTSMLPYGTWRHVEIYYKPDASAGRFVVKIDGNAEIDYTGNTNNNNGTEIWAIGFGNPLGNAYTNSHGSIDNVIVDDAEWIRPAGQTQYPRISGLFPTIGGTHSQWNGSYADIDDKPPSDADGITVNALDQISSFGHGGLVGSVEAIRTVQVDAYLRGQGNFAPKNVKPMIRTGGADFLGADRAVPYLGKSHYARKIWQVNPQTGAAWTPADIAGLEIGVKSGA
jgi:hypothetical protein